MSSTVTSTTTTASPLQASSNKNLHGFGRLHLDGTDRKFGDFRDDLARDGYAIIKGAIPEDRALHYADEMFSWLEGLFVAIFSLKILKNANNYLTDSGLGYNRDDSSTVHKDNLPVINEKGMCLHYGVAHEDFTWAIRSEPGVIAAFEKVYDDEDLIVSFDAVNFGFPK